MTPSGFQTNDPESSWVARELPKRDYLKLKAAIRDLLDACGGARRAAEHTRIKQPQLDRYADLTKADEFMPADVVADLEAVCGKPYVTEALAEIQAFALEASPDYARGITDIEALLAAATKTTAAIAEAWAARADGEVTATERLAVHRGVREAMDTLRAVDAAFMGGGR